MGFKSDYSEALAKCPFFLADNAKHKRIICEGITDDCTVQLSFGRKPEARTQHKKIFCDDAYEKCEIYQMLMQKYDE